MRAAAYELDDCAGETDPFGRSLSDPEPPPPLASPPESEPLSESREFVSAEAVARSSTRMPGVFAITSLNLSIATFPSINSFENK